MFFAYSVIGCELEMAFTKRTYAAEVDRRGRILHHETIHLLRRRVVEPAHEERVDFPSSSVAVTFATARSLSVAAAILPGQRVLSRRDRVYKPPMPAPPYATPVVDSAPVVLHTRLGVVRRLSSSVALIAVTSVSFA